MSIDVSIAGCMVGEIEYKVLYETRGTYSCLIHSIPSNNDTLTLTVDYSIFRTELTGDRELAERIRNRIVKNKLPNGRYLLRSLVSWHGQLERPRTSAEGKFEECNMVQEKLLPELVIPWAQYHRRLGFDRIYIYDNKCPVNLNDHLSDLD